MGEVLDFIGSHTKGGNLGSVRWQISKYKHIYRVGPLGFLFNNVDTGEGSEIKDCGNDNDCLHKYT